MERERNSERDNSIIGGNYGGEISREARDARDRATLAGRQAEEYMDDAAMKDEGAVSTLRQKADERKEQAAGKVEHAAGTLRDQAQRYDGMASDAANRAADKLDDAAQYMHEHDTSEMMDDVRKFVRDHPMQAIAGAAIGGFFLARMLP